MSSYRARNAARGRRHPMRPDDVTGNAKYTCECGKLGYSSRKAALLQARRWQSKGVRHLDHGVKLRAYECKHTWWHLTSQDAEMRAFYKDRGLR